MICAHEPCQCEESRYEKDGLSYCSEVCADAAALGTGEPGSPCPCPHPPCA